MDDPGFIALMKEYYTVQVWKWRKINSNNHLNHRNHPNHDIRVSEWVEWLSNTVKMSINNILVSNDQNQQDYHHKTMTKISHKKSNLSQRQQLKFTQTCSLAISRPSKTLTTWRWRLSIEVRCSISHSLWFYSIFIIIGNIKAVKNLDYLKVKNAVPCCPILSQINVPNIIITSIIITIILWLFGLSYYFNMTGQGLGITHIVNTAEGNKAANVTLDVDQLEANGNHFDQKWL